MVKTPKHARAGIEKYGILRLRIRFRSQLLAQDDKVLERGNQLDFQVNDETYFIDLADEEGKWLVFAQTPTGVRRIPVYVDAPESEELHVLVEDGNRRKIVN